MRRILVTLLVLAATGAGTSTPAQGAERLRLNFRTAPGERATGPVATRHPLRRGVPYVIAVSGTGSIWPASQWRRGRACGAAERGPVTRSRRVANGPASWDAETVFAVPAHVRFFGLKCSRNRVPLHFGRRIRGGFQINAGEGYGHKEPVGGARSVPRADHRYLYRLTGQGRRAHFRFFDSARRADNYGVLRVVVRTARECAATRCASRGLRNTDGRVPGRVVTSRAIRLGARFCGERTLTVRIGGRGILVRGGRVLISGRKHGGFGRPKRGRIRVGRLPRGSFRLTVRARTSRGQVLVGRRTYLFCLPRVRLFP